MPLLLSLAIPAPFAQEAPVDVAPVIPPAPRTPLTAVWPADLPLDRDSVSAEVQLLVTIDEIGVVTAVSLVTGSPPFSDLATALVTATAFDPARDGATAIAVEVPVRIVYDPPPINVDGVLNGPDGAPLAGATVRLGDRTDRTRDDGSFAFRGVPPSELPLSVDAGTLVVQQRLLTVNPDEAIHLVLGASAPDAATVVGVYRVVREEVVRRSLTAEELRTTPGTMGDPLRAIANLPGAVRTPLDAGWLLVRGGDPRDTGVYIDGVRVPLIYHLGGFTSVVHPGFVDRVDFFPGGQSARYGRATAGVVDLITAPRPDRLEVRAGANIILAGGFVAVPFRNGGVSAGFRRSYLDAVLGAVPTLSEEQAQIAPRFWDWQARVDVGSANVFGLGYIDTIDASTGNADQLTITINTQRIQGSWTGRLFDKPLLIKPMYGYELRHIVIEAVGTTQDRLVTGPGLRAELQDEGADQWGWSAGVDWTVDNFAFRYDTVTLGGVFWSPEPYADLRWGQETRAVLGLRADTLLIAGQRSRGAVSPRFSLTHPVNSKLTLVADAGIYHQAPAYDLLIGPPEGTTLALETSYGGGAGARAELGPIKADLDLYARRIDNLTGYEDDGTLGQGDGLAFGVESITRYTWDRLTGWVTASYARSLRRESRGLPWEPSLYDQPFSLVLVDAYDLGRHWTLAGRWRYSSGFPVPDTSDDIQAYDVLRQTAVPLVGNELGRLEPFHSLDLKIARRVEGRSFDMEFYLDVQNVYWRRVAEPVITGFADVYNVYAYGFGLPTLPILGIEGTWKRRER